MDSLLDIFFPPKCILCNTRIIERKEQQISLCDPCHESIRRIEGPLCRVCGLPLPHFDTHPTGIAGDNRQRLCGSCLTKMPNYDEAHSLFFYGGAIRDLLLQFKFNQSFTALSCLRDLCRLEELPYRDCDLYLPVPLHRHRLQYRGFNQAYFLLKTLFPESGKKISPNLLKRCRKTLPQIGLSGKERRKNLQGAFCVKRSETLRGRHICLVDDVFTTGTTVEECSIVLRACGVASIKIFCIARAL